MLNDQTNVVNYYLIVVLKFPRSIIINVKVGSSVVPPFNNLPLLSIDNEKKARKTAYKLCLCVECSSAMIVPGLIRY